MLSQNRICGDESGCVTWFRPYIIAIAVVIVIVVVIIIITTTTTTTIIIIIIIINTNNNWSNWNSNEKLKEKFGSCTRKTFNRFITKDSYTWNITHKTESTAVWSLKPEWWGSREVPGRRSCDKRHTYHIISYNNNNNNNNNNNTELQKTAILGTAHILRKVLT